MQDLCVTLCEAAYAMQGDSPEAKAACQDFLALWKDADPDPPLEAGKGGAREVATAG